MSQHLLIPVMPTPNGPLHLGHISGPFLRMDVLARSLRQQGQDVSIVSASDGWETHVLLKSYQSACAPEELSRRYHLEIDQGLRALDIEYDDFFFPLDPEHRARLEETSHMVLAKLAETPGALRLVDERVPFSTMHDIPLVGALIEGRCPRCGAGMGGFYCEDCGGEISPGQLVEPRSRLPNDAWEWRTYRSLFLDVGDVCRIRGVAERICRDRQIVKIGIDGLRFNQNLVRLTHPGSWGTPVEGYGVTPGAVFFSYSSLFALSLFCASLASCYRTARPPAGSRPKTVTSFGMDNAVPYIAAVTSQAVGAYGASFFDHCLTNHFGTLDGKKFSTSRNHAIWAREASADLAASTDTIRAFLCFMNPQTGKSDFSKQDFQHFKWEWQFEAEQLLELGMKAKTTSSRFDRDLLCRLLARRDAAFNPEDFALSDGSQTLRAWLDLARVTPPDRNWALGFAVLAYPVMPSLCRRIWEHLGHAGLPTIAALAWH